MHTDLNLVVFTDHFELITKGFIIFSAPVLILLILLPALTQNLPPPFSLLNTIQGLLLKNAYRLISHLKCVCTTAVWCMLKTVEEHSCLLPCNRKGTLFLVFSKRALKAFSKAIQVLHNLILLTLVWKLGEQ